MIYGIVIVLALAMLGLVVWTSIRLGRAQSVGGQAEEKAIEDRKTLDRYRAARGRFAARARRVLHARRAKR